MENILINDFCEKTFAPNCSVNVSYNEAGKKEYFAQAGWLDWGCYKSVIDASHNGLMIDIRKRFIVLDADTKEAKKKIIELLKHFGIWSEDYKEKFITKSISNVLKGKKYKLHFWLKKKGHELKKAINCFDLGLDFISDVILEHATTTIHYNYTSMPECPDGLINEILNNTPSKMKQRINDIEKINDEAIKNKMECSEEFFNDFVDILDDSRAKEYNSWNQVGLVLASYSKDYFYIWNDFSKRCIAKYPGEVALKKQWQTFNGPEDQPAGALTVGTLLYWAKEDNEEKYNELKIKYFHKKNNQLLNLFLNLNNKDVAKFYYLAFPNKYIFGGDVKNKKSGWFGYKPNNIIINYGSVPTGLLNHISEYMQAESLKIQSELTDKFHKIKADKKMDSDEKEKEKAIIKANLKKVSESYLKLGSSTFINGCICFLADSYFNEEIDILLDSNNKFLAFKNGLYDFEKNEFRPILPTDYISKCTNYDYNEKINIELQNTINNLLSSIFGTEEVKNYFMAVHGLSLFSNSSESIYLLNGKGGNGKGLLTSIIQAALGDYFLTAENTFLTTNYKGSQANPTLAAAPGRRYLSISEPEDGTSESVFNMGLVKLLTGKDTVCARGLYKDNINYVPMFTPFIQCNEIPKLKTVDAAAKRRFKIINFPFQFVDNPTKANEKLVNRNLKELINKDFYNQFILLLIKYANEYKNKTLIIPQEVQNATNEYFEENNILLNWFRSYIVETNNNKDIIKTSILYDHYKQATGEQISNVIFMKHLKTFDVKISVLDGSKILRGFKLETIKYEETPEEAPQTSDLDV